MRPSLYASSGFSAARCPSALFESRKAGKGIGALHRLGRFLRLHAFLIRLAVVVLCKEGQRQDQLLLDPGGHVELARTHDDLVVAVLFNGHGVGLGFALYEEKGHSLFDFKRHRFAAAHAARSDLRIDREIGAGQLPTAGRTNGLPVHAHGSKLGVKHRDQRGELVAREVARNLGSGAGKFKDVRILHLSIVIGGRAPRAAVLPRPPS